MHPEGRTLYMSDARGNIRAFDPETLKQSSATPAHTNYVAALRFSADARYLVSAGWDGVVKVHDLAGGAEPVVLKDHPPTTNGEPNRVLDLIFTAGDSRILGGSHDGILRLWDRATGDLIRSFSGGGGQVTARGFLGAAFFGAFTPDGERVIAGSNYGELKVWDARPRQTPPPPVPAPPAE